MWNVLSQGQRRDGRGKKTQDVWFGQNYSGECGRGVVLPWGAQHALGGWERGAVNVKPAISDAPGEQRQQILQLDLLLHVTTCVVYHMQAIWKLKQTWFDQKLKKKTKILLKSQSNFYFRSVLISKRSPHVWLKSSINLAVQWDPQRFITQQQWTNFIMKTDRPGKSMELNIKQIWKEHLKLQNTLRFPSRWKQD